MIRATVRLWLQRSNFWPGSYGLHNSGACFDGRSFDSGLYLSTPDDSHRPQVGDATRRLRSTIVTTIECVPDMAGELGLYISCGP